MCYMILIHDIYGEVCLLVLARNGVLGVHDDLIYHGTLNFKCKLLTGLVRELVYLLLYIYDKRESLHCTL